MKKTYLALFCTAFLFLFISQTNAQISFQIGGGLGYSVPSGDYGGTTVDYYNGEKYGMESGFNFHAKARLGLLFINAFGEVGYTTFSGEGDIPEGNNASVDISNKVFSAKVGPEFKFSIPLSPITPYLDGFISLNTFSGTVKFNAQGTDLPSSEQDIESASRIGLGVGGGVLLSLGGLNLDLSIQYHLMNVAGKKYDGDITKNQRIESYRFLNDDKDSVAGTIDDHFIADSRNISAIEFKLSLMFGL